MSKTYKLGTRKSLLAMAQSQWVAHQIEKNNPFVKIELIGIETQGDKIVDIPLREAEGKDFFVTELDQALKNQKVDLCVHSYKDLSLNRPSEILLAATPKREDPRDVIVFSPNIVKKLEQGQTIKIGTSSPRRLENIPTFLEQALPQFSKKPVLKFLEIRGNVNTRLSRLHEAEDSQKFLDGVVLALAGLNRLWSHASSQKEIAPLLENVKWMILPLDQCPAAPAQGALAIECSKANHELIQILSKLNDSKTCEEIQQERAVLETQGGGCHQRFGATCISAPFLEKLMWIKGQNLSGQALDKMSWKSPPPPSRKVSFWDGMIESKNHDIQTIVFDANKIKNSHACFVAHSRAATETALPVLKEKRVWTSGAKSWFSLAEKGIWVEGCGEGLGFHQIIPTIQKSVLQLPDFQKWCVLTHTDGIDGWQNSSAVPTYSIRYHYSDESISKLKNSSHIFWGSSKQFDLLSHYAQPHAHHACGAGKTADQVTKFGLKNFNIFPSIHEWRKWVKNELST